MTKIIKTVILGLVCTAFGALPLLAGNGAPSGAHYNLNIIGVENGTNLPDLTGSNRHTIFVALFNSGDTHSNIWLTQGPFTVCDGNAFDAAHDCDTGAAIGNKMGAVFRLPCDTEFPADVACVGYSQEYEIWARALGSPKLINGLPPGATITLCAFDVATQTEVCNLNENVVTLGRTKGKSTFQDVTKDLTILQSPTLGNFPLFAAGFEDWVWQYQNKGLRLAQLRFYAEGPPTTLP
jgi:hypothetical protein